MPPAPAARDGSELVLGSVGTYSGPIGAATISMIRALQAWVKHTNVNGGIQGHLISHRIYDDGGDPARHRALVREAVEQDGVVAFLANAEVVTGEASVDYLNEKRVPVIGTDGGGEWQLASPMYFPVSAVGSVAARSWLPPIAQLVVPTGKTKMGTLVCVEAPTCDDFHKFPDEQADDLGVEIVYRGRASTAQPDYTAECLAARNAGVEVFLIAETGDAVSRIATSCARQAYEPVYALAYPAVTDRFRTDSNLDGALGVTLTFPFFQAGTPATDEFQQVMGQFAGDDWLRIANGVLTFGWVAGKLLEKAATQTLSPRVSPTSETILAGLWSISNETLGGLTQPLTFVENRPPKPAPCAVLVGIIDGEWTSPNGYQLLCE